VIRITEMFPSIQGEGIYIGTPTIIVRLAGCNLKCRWCDTPKAHRVGVFYNEDMLAKEVAQHNEPWVLLTGGEPMMWDLRDLIDELQKLDKLISIETNGTIAPNVENKDFEIDFWTISPKLSNSGMEDKVDIDTLVALYDWAGQDKCQLKFVIEDPEPDIQEVQALLHRLTKALGEEIRCPIVLQPQQQEMVVGEQTKHYFELMKAIFEEARMKLEEYDFRVLPQLHKLMEMR